MLRIPIEAEMPVIDGESLRTRITQFRVGGVLGEPESYTDLRGAPIGDKVQVWKWDRMVLPYPKSTRRVREQYTAEFCPEGWHSASGGNDCPMEGGATCHTVGDTQWRRSIGTGALSSFDRGTFNEFHAEHPVVWRITVKRGKNVRVLRYCDPELPDEYRIDPDADPCSDCHLLIPLLSTAYAIDCGGVCEACGLARYGDRAPEYLIA